MSRSLIVKLCLLEPTLSFTFSIRLSELSCLSGVPLPFCFRPRYKRSPSSCLQTVLRVCRQRPSFFRELPRDTLLFTLNPSFFPYRGLLPPFRSCCLGLCHRPSSLHLPSRFCPLRFRPTRSPFRFRFSCPPSSRRFQFGRRRPSSLGFLLLCSQREPFPLTCLLRLSLPSLCKPRCVLFPLSLPFRLRSLSRSPGAFRLVLFPSLRLLPLCWISRSFLPVGLRLL